VFSTRCAAVRVVALKQGPLCAIQRYGRWAVLLALKQRPQAPIVRETVYSPVVKHFMEEKGCTVLSSKPECLRFRTVETRCAKYNSTFTGTYDLFAYVSVILQKRIQLFISQVLQS
jgi:hypothetical protein